MTSRYNRKYRIPDGKVRLHVLIPEDLYNRLITIAPSLYGKNRGALSGLVTDALRTYLDSLESAHTTHTNPSIQVREEFNQFLKRVKIEEGFIPLELPIHKVRAIMVRAFRRCRDERTQNKKLHTWYIMGYIKPIPFDIKPISPKDWGKPGIRAIEFVARGGA